MLPDLIHPSESVKETNWFQKAYASNEYTCNFEEGYLYLNKSILHSITGEFLGIAKIRINESLFKSSFVFFNKELHQMKVISKNDEVIYELNQTKNGEGYLIHHTITPFNWRISYQFKRDSLSPFLNQQLIINYLVILSSLILVWIGIKYLSHSILRRIHTLADQMKETQEGNLQLKIEATPYNDEIGSLTHSFQKMITDLNKLIHERYVSELRQKELELYVLQEKVNPHFLYNILSTINWIALENNQTKISHIISNLTTFYRTTLGKGQQFNLLEKEILNIKSYIELQRIAREYSGNIEGP